MYVCANRFGAIVYVRDITDCASPPFSINTYERRHTWIHTGTYNTSVAVCVCRTEIHTNIMPNFFFLFFAICALFLLSTMDFIVTLPLLLFA